jgi:hypothetical protein
VLILPMIAAALAALLSGAAVAAEKSILVLRVPTESGGWPSAERRTSAELVSLGFDVEMVLPQDGQQGPIDSESAAAAFPAEWARSLAVQRDAVAVVRVTQSGVGDTATVLVDILDRVTGKIATRRVRVAQGEPPPDAESAGLLAVELLYASLLEIQAPHRSRGEIPPPAVVKSLVREGVPSSRGQRFSLHVGTSLSIPRGGIAPEPSLVFGATYFTRMIPWLGVATDLRVGTLPATITAADGSADLGWTIARLQAVAALWPRRTVTAFFTAGVGWLAAWSRGSAADRPTSLDVGGVPIVTAGVGIGVRLRPDVRVRLMAEPSFLAAPVRIRFGGMEVAALKSPLVDAAVALEWLWP